MRSLFLALVLGLGLTGCNALDRFIVSEPAPAPATAPAALSAVPSPGPRPPAARERPLLILLDLRSQGVEQQALSVLSQRLWYELLRSGDFMMVPRDGVRRLLESRRISLTDPYGPPLPMGAIGRALRADYLVFGSVGQVGQTYTLDAQLLDVEKDRVVAVAAATAEESIEDLLGQIPGLSRSLLRPLGGGRDVGFRTVPRAPLRDSHPPEVREPETREISADSEVSERPQPPPREVTPPSELESPGVSATAPTVEEAPAPIEVPSSEPAPEAETQSDSSADATLQTQMWRPESRGRSAPSGPASLTASVGTAVERPGEPAGDALEPEPAPAEIRPVPADEPGAAEPVLDEKLTSARRMMLQAIAEEDNPYGTSARNPPEAQRLKSEALKLPVGSRERVRLLQQALELDPRNSDILAHTARARMANLEYDRALQDCRLALKGRRDDSVLYTILGSIHHNRGEYMAAAAAQERALELDDTNYFAQYNLALSFQQLDTGRATGAFSRFIQMAEDVPEQQGFVERAREFLTE
jgi:hypothetical protein